MLDIFERCGIGDIKDAKLFKEGDSRTSYYVNDEETARYSGADNTIVVWLLNDTKAVDAIYYDDYTIYEDGQVQQQMAECYVPKALQDEYRVSCQLLVKQYLAQPDTAKFESGGSKWAFAVEDDLDIIQSTVTGKNALGQDITEKFQVKMNRSTGSPVSCIIGGTEYIQ